MKFTGLRRLTPRHGALSLSQTNMADDSDNSPTTNTHKQHRRAKMCRLLSFFHYSCSEATGNMNIHYFKMMRGETEIEKEMAKNKERKKKENG